MKYRAKKKKGGKKKRLAGLDDEVHGFPTPERLGESAKKRERSGERGKRESRGWNIREKVAWISRFRH